MDPRNRQAQVWPLNKIVHLMTGIGGDSHPMAKDGMAVAGGAAIALGGLVGLGPGWQAEDLMMIIRQCCDCNLSFEPAELSI